MRVSAWVAAVLVLLSATNVDAHLRSVSYSNWSVRDDGATVRCRVSLLDLSALEAVGITSVLTISSTTSSETALGAYLRERLKLIAGDEPCAAVSGSLNRLQSDDAFVSFEWQVACPTSGERLIRSDLLVDIVPGHLHFLRVHDARTARDSETVLDSSEREVELANVDDVATESGFATLATFVAVGFEHILSGWDHLAFLLVLVLTALSLRDLAMVVTGFTVGHSLTLALAVLGYVTPQANAVEALIGLSIALIAVENIWLSEGRRRLGLPLATVGLLAVGAGLSELFGGIGGRALLGLAVFSACHFALIRRASRPERWRWSVASLFGLIHGFAFSGVLTEMSLSSSRLAYSLLGFNVGVEVGQLAVVALAWPLLVLWRRRGEQAQLALVQWGSAIALCAGVFWFVSRAF